MSGLAQNAWLVLPVIAVVSAVLGLLLRPLAMKFDWVDHPGERKVHQESTPWVGGIAVFLSICLPVFLLPSLGLMSSHFTPILLTGAAFMLLAGAVDDLWGLSPILRFLMQVLACLAIIYFSGYYLQDFGALFSNSVANLGPLSVPITVFAALGVINAFNLIDGMDGLAGSLYLVAAVGMAAFGSQSGYSGTYGLLTISSAAVFGFLLLNARFPWNKKAKLFLGDAGSLALGFLLAWSFIRLGNGPDRAFMPMTAVWLFAVPLLDTATLIWRRWREGRSALHADQNHLHHIFLRAGFSVEATWGMIVLMAILLAGIGIIFELPSVPDWLSFYVFMVVAFSYYFYLKHCWASQKFLGRHFIHHDFEIEEGFVASRRL